MITTEAVKKFNMLSPGDRVLVALSGGADSVCLLHCLLRWSEELKISVCAAHFNHGLRGDEAERDARFAAEQCESLGVPFICGSEDVAAYAKREHLGTEAAGRILRYAFLEDAAEKLSCNKIATAHNADDNAETLLLNLCRGGGAKGLSGIPPVRENIVRPLILTPRSEIEAFLAEENIPHVEDSTNAEDEYTRNILRHKVMPVLREINPAFSAAALRTAQSLREDEEYLDLLAERFIAENAAGNMLPASKMRELPTPVKLRVIRRMCPCSLSRAHCEAVLGLLGETELSFADVPGMRIAQDSGFIIFGAECEKMGEYELPEKGEIYIPEAKLRIKVSRVADCKEVFKSVNKFDFNCGGVRGKITLTSRCDGDRISLAHRGCTKSVKELFSEKKLPQSLRNTTPVFRDEEGIIALYGFGVSKRCEAKPGDDIIRIEIENYFTGDKNGNCR